MSVFNYNFKVIDAIYDDFIENWKRDDALALDNLTVACNTY